MTFIRAFGKFLMILGTGFLVAAVAWWYLFFEQMLGENVKQASECFYFTTDRCSLGQVVGFLGDIPTYSPFAFWIAVGTMTCGLIIVLAGPRGS